MGSYCCIKTTKTQKNSSIKLDELPKKSDSFILNLKNEYLPPNKGLNPDLRNLNQNQNNLNLNYIFKYLSFYQYFYLLLIIHSFYILYLLYFQDIIY